MVKAQIKKKDKSNDADVRMREEVFGINVDKPARLIFAVECLPGMKYISVTKRMVIEFQDTWEGNNLTFKGYDPSGEIVEYNIQPWAAVRVDDSAVSGIMLRHEQTRIKLYGLRAVPKKSGQDTEKTSSKEKKVRGVKDPTTGYGTNTDSHFVADLILTVGTSKDDRKKILSAIEERLSDRIPEDKLKQRACVLYSNVKTKNPKWWENT